MILPNAVVIGTEGWYEFDGTWPEVMDIAVFGWQDYDEDDDTVSPLKYWPPF